MARHTSRSNNDPRTVALMLFTIGGVLLFGAIRAWFTVNSFKNIEKRCTESTTGIVTNVTKEQRTRRRKKRTTTYYVYITKYVYNAQGKNRSNTSTLSTSEQLAEGSNIEVFFDPDDPDVSYTAYDDPGTSTLVGVIVTAAIGIVLVAAGAAVRKKLKPKDSGYDSYPKDDFTLLQ